MTKAEQLLKAPIADIEAAATRKSWTEDGKRQYEFDDKSCIQVRKLSGRSAFASNGLHLKSY